MADTLLDILNRGTQSATSQPVAGYGSTDTLATLMAARSGKAVSPTAGPREENLLESAAVQQTKEGLADVAAEAAPKIDAIAQSAQGIAQQSKIAQNNLTERSKQVAQGAALDAQKLLDRAYAERVDLRASENKARAEQIGFLIRLSNDKYLDNLQRAGEEARATSAIGFAEAYQDAELGGLFDLFGDAQERQRLLAMDEAAFAEEIGKASVDWDIFFQGLKAKQENAQAMFGGISEMVSGGAKLATAKTASDKADADADAAAAAAAAPTE